MSARLKRFDSVVRSGPRPSPSLPYLWHFRHWPFSKASLPLAASPFLPSFSRNASSSSYLYFDSTLLLATPGSAFSLGKLCTYHLRHDSNSLFQSPFSAPNCRSFVQWRSSSTACQRLSGGSLLAARINARNGAGLSAFGLV